MIYIYCNTSGIVDPLPVLVSDGGMKYTGQIVGENRVGFILGSKTPPAGWGASIYWGKDNSCRTVIPVNSGAYEGGLLDPAVPTLDYAPPIPSFTRDEVCGAKVTLSGLTITTAEFGTQPWFELAWQCLSSVEDRRGVLDQKKKHGDTGQVIEFFTRQQKIYDEPGVWLNNLTTQVGEFNQPLFLQFVTEILTAGMVPVVVFDGDNGDNPIDGYPNALRQLPIVTNLLADYNSNILYARFWDGVFYGSTPENIQNFGREFRKILPEGKLAIEFNPGHIPVGNGPEDYAPNGMMTDYDVIVGEFEFPDYRQNSTWQVVARLVSKYNRPPDQPVNDDPNPPYYLAPGNARGQYFFWAWEIGEYQWVRNQVSLASLITAGRYFRSMGCSIVGLPS
jgi:hypothetical protein